MNKRSNTGSRNWESRTSLARPKLREVASNFANKAFLLVNAGPI